MIFHVIKGLPKAAGTSVFCAEIAREQVLMGHDVCVAVVKAFAKGRYPLAPRVRLMTIESLVAEGELRPGCVVHIHGLWSLELHKAVLAARRAHCAVVWSPHGMLTPWAMRNKRWKKLLGWHLYQKRDLRLADLIHVTSASEEDDVQRLDLRNRIVRAPLGVFLPDRQDGAMPQRTSDDRRTVLFVSRVQRKKGLPNLLSAWAQLTPKERAGWQIRVVGPNEEHHVEELRSQAEVLGVSCEILFSGPLYGKDLAEAYKNASLFVLPTHSENFGLVVAEAMSYGLPVITTKGTPWQELESAHCGMWIDIGVDPLERALREMIALPEVERAEMGGRGRMLVERKYTWRATAEAIQNGYEEVLRESNETH